MGSVGGAGGRVDLLQRRPQPYHRRVLATGRKGINQDALSSGINGGGPGAGVHTSFAHNPAVTNLSTEDGYSIQGSFPKPIVWVVSLLFAMGFIAGGFILGAVHNAILLIVVVVIFGFVAALLIWNACWGRRGVIGFVNRYPDADLRTAKDGKYVKVTGLLLVEISPSNSHFKWSQDACTLLLACMSTGVRISKLPTPSIAVLPGV